MNKHKCSHINGYYLLTRQRNPSLRWHKSVVGFGLPKKKKWWSCAKCFLLTYYTIASLLPVGDEFRSIAPREEKTKNSQLLCIHVNSIDLSVYVWVWVLEYRSIRTIIASLSVSFHAKMNWGLNECTGFGYRSPTIESERVNKIQNVRSKFGVEILLHWTFAQHTDTARRTWCVFANKNVKRNETKRQQRQQHQHHGIDSGRGGGTIRDIYTTMYDSL